MNLDIQTYLPNLMRRPGSLRLLLLVALALVSACSKEVTVAALPEGSQVLALGDSLTEGAGVLPDQAWPALLAKRTKWQVINGGVSGDTSSEALQRFPALLDEHHPVLVLVTLGGNDMLRHISRQETIANLERILALIEARGAKPVLLATPNPSLIGAVFQNLSPPDFYREIADARQVPLIEDAIADVLSKPQLKGDPLHPSIAGHALLATRIFEELKSIGYAR